MYNNARGSYSGDAQPYFDGYRTDDAKLDKDGAPQTHNTHSEMPTSMAVSEANANPHYASGDANLQQHQHQQHQQHGHPQQQQQQHHPQYSAYSAPGPDQMMGSYINQLGTPHLVSSLFMSPPTEETTISTPGTAVMTAPRHSVEMNLRVNNGGGPTPPFLPDYPLYTYDFRYGRAKDGATEQPQPQGQPQPQPPHGSGQPQTQTQAPIPSKVQKTSPIISKSTPPRVSPVTQKAGLNVSPTLSAGSPWQQSPSPEEMAYSSSFSAKSENPKRVYKKKTLTAQQKQVHNQIERKYRSAINLGLLRLKSLVPWYQLVEGEDKEVVIKREEEWTEGGEMDPLRPGSHQGSSSTGLHPSQDPSGCPYSIDELATLSSKAGILQVSAEYVQYLQSEVVRLKAATL
ncbi:hypothetical protein CJU90_1674 [Yarrowia sp. C11]|nr:hypothetical protein CKK34_0397 [Yarrowia sp. E02]KAG5371628.1 hypothetical protein CJU90_1674 [Yarrowia sp. C11]